MSHANVQWNLCNSFKLYKRRGTVTPSISFNDLKKSLKEFELKGL